MDLKRIGLEKGHKLAQLSRDTGVLAIWSLFFKSFEWLEKAYQDGKPPILVGSALNDILRYGAALPQRAHVALVYQGAAPISLFLECLQPYAMHFHRFIQYDYAFKSHNITLNANSVMTGLLANGIYTRWPERLTVVSGQKRQSAFLVWGEDTIKLTEAIVGLGQNLESDESVSSICHIDLQLQRCKGIIRANFHRHPYALYRHDSLQSCYRYAGNYEEEYQRYLTTALEERTGPTKRKCEACIMKGDETPDMM
jgi:hypothetical protein